MQISDENGPTGGRHIARLEGVEAEMTFSRASPQLVIIDHTGVPDSLRGKGVGQALAHHAVEAARAGGGRSFRSARFSRRRRNGIRNGATW